MSGDDAPGGAEAKAEAASDPRALAEDVARRSVEDVRRFLPYLADLADQIEIEAHWGVPAAGVAEDGRVFVNPVWFGTLARREALYVMAHELWHLALRSHQRADATDAWELNIAHDWIINDILTEELGMRPPRGGLFLPMAREQSAETLVRWIKTGDGRVPSVTRLWRERAGEPARATPAKSALEEQLRSALGLGEAAEDGAGDPAQGPRLQTPRDLLTEADLKALGVGRGKAKARVKRVSAEALRRICESTLSRHALLTDAFEAGQGSGEGNLAATMEAVTAAQPIPIELALQRGVDMLGPPTRSYARASRRQGDRRDVVLAGRIREGWSLNILLDTSGSMVGLLPHILGALRVSAEACGADSARLIQVSDVVTGDDRVALTALDRFEFKGFGGSDLRPGFAHLAQDPEVTGVAVITDMAIDYPASPPPYDVVWLAVDCWWASSLQAPYGRLVHVQL